MTTGDEIRYSFTRAPESSLVAHVCTLRQGHFILPQQAGNSTADGRVGLSSWGYSFLFVVFLPYSTVVLCSVIPEIQRESMRVEGDAAVTQASGNAFAGWLLLAKI